MMDTIFALSSGPLPAGVAVIRVSGPEVRNVLVSITGKVPSARVASFGDIRSRDGSVIDRGLTVFFPAPASFTGEDVAEFNLHGSRAGVARILDELGRFQGLRSAEPGEFTRRAFLNGKIDLTEAEALGDLIEAETEAQRRFAVLNSGGGQRVLYEGWRTRLIYARAMLEAELDFSDQDDVPGSVADAILSDIEVLASEMERHVQGFARAEIIRNGFDVVIVGPPNAGKSSLLNALARRDVAIVSEEPGTTRDLLEVSLDLGGLKIRVTDTAGIREATGKVEAIGIERALARAGNADLVVQLCDLSSSEPVEAITGAFLVGSKSDLANESPFAGPRISTKSGDGITSFLAEIERRALLAAGNGGDVLPARIRHVEYLNRALGFLRDATKEFDEQIELRAEALRLSAEQLGRITGQVDVEDILDVVFSRFCIGK